jgi:hypothetical protein
MNAEGMINSWSDYRRALPQEDKTAFDSICNRVRMHASAATYAAFTDPFESAVLSILLEQEKEILALRKSDVR